MKEQGPGPHADPSHLGLGWGSLWGEDFIGNMKGLKGWRCRMLIFHWKYEGFEGLEMQNVDFSSEKMKEMDPQPYTNPSHLGLGWGPLWGEDFIRNMKGFEGLEMQNVDISLEI